MLDARVTPILIRGPVGLGDTIYLRCAVREITDRFDIYLETPWQQLYRDLPIRCVRRNTKLRAQEKNAARPDLAWAVPPSIPSVRVHYAGSRGTMLQGLFDALGLRQERITFDLPRFAPTPARRPYVVIRPAIVRKEWPALARNPRPEYLAMAAEALRPHFDIVSVADLVPDVEWPLLPLPYADETFHSGELQVERLMALVAGAAGVVAGVGWAIPAAVAYRVPLFVIYGGSGAHDGPARIFDQRMPTGLVHHALPDNFCRCADRQHACDKTISSIAKQIDDWAVGLVARATPAMA